MGSGRIHLLHPTFGSGGASDGIFTCSGSDKVFVSVADLWCVDPVGIGLIQTQSVLALNVPGRADGWASSLI